MQVSIDYQQPVPEAQLVAWKVVVLVAFFGCTVQKRDETKIIPVWEQIAGTSGNISAICVMGWFPLALVIPGELSCSTNHTRNVR